MEQRLLHTPEGVRDIYSGEYARKKALLQKLHRVVEGYGYCDIETPTFEYFDVFSREVGTVPSRELYKFFDREGNTLVLRPDVTPSIARAVAKYFAPEDMPVRLCYMANTFINSSDFQGRLKETTQIGAELIGDGSAEADAELLALVVESLLKTGLKEFQVSIGHVDFIQSLFEATNLEDEQKEEIRTLIANRNFFGVEEILDHYEIADQVKEAFHQLPELTGGPEILADAGRIAPGEAARLAVERLRQIYDLLKIYGVEDHVTFDLSMSGSYGYYTGIIFRAYTYGTGDAVVRGGRYDHLLEKFGKKTPSIGFAIILDELMSALDRQKIKVETGHRNLLVYTDAMEQWAISLARSFRAKGKNVEMMKRNSWDERETFEAYGKRSSVASMLYLREDRKIEVINLQTGEEKLVNTKKKTKQQ